MMVNWKGFGRKRWWPNFKILSRHSPEGTEENHENIKKDIRSPGPRSERGILRIQRRTVCWPGDADYRLQT